MVNQRPTELQENWTLCIIYQNRKRFCQWLYKVQREGIHRPNYIFLASATWQNCKLFPIVAVLVYAGTGDQFLIGVWNGRQWWELRQNLVPEINLPPHWSLIMRALNVKVEKISGWWQSPCSRKSCHTCTIQHIWKGQCLSMDQSYASKFMSSVFQNSLKQDDRYACIVIDMDTAPYFSYTVQKMQLCLFSIKSDTASKMEWLKSGVFIQQHWCILGYYHITIN